MFEAWQLNHLSKLDQLHRKRVIRAVKFGIPFELALGYAKWESVVFKVSPLTLIPRPTTEDLGYLTALILSETKPSAKKFFYLIDVGCGTGFFAATIAFHLKRIGKPIPSILLVDVVEASLKLCKENLSFIDKKHLILADANRLPIKQEILENSVIVTNPPYLDKDQIRANLLWENVKALEADLPLIRKILSYNTVMTVLETNTAWSLTKHKGLVLESPHLYKFFVKYDPKSVIGYLLTSNQHIASTVIFLSKNGKTQPLYLEQV